MKSKLAFHSTLLAVLLSGSLIAQGQSFAGTVEPAEIDGISTASSDADLYTDGTRAINEGRWPNAEAIFAMIASQHGDHSDGALYWKAYAENKQGHTKPALATCAELGTAFPPAAGTTNAAHWRSRFVRRLASPSTPKRPRTMI